MPAAEYRGGPPGAAVAAVKSVVEAQGLACRGGFDFAAGEGPPLPGSGGLARAVLLIGNLGAEYWPFFQHWLGEQAPPRDPLDTWSRSVIAEAARAVDAHAVSPSDKPYHPFQQWAMRAEGLQASPLGILMHPGFGLWHAYRGALLFAHPLGLEAAPKAAHACATCVDRPCLKACPVGAYREDGFAYGNCLSWVRSEENGACRAYGCSDRNACPVGASYRYPPAVQAFHMAAFARL